MAGFLTSGSVLMCPHGGTVTAITSNTGVQARTGAVLRSSDTFTVAGCPFSAGPAYHPCVTVTWVKPSAHIRVEGDFALTADSVGLCQAADQAVQGTCTVVTADVHAGGR
ncbi:MAG TPA: hypothetical protein VHF47_08995 [Acidimicrobiales bacterium]|nr:hypothetical protein [Acidimicrobiales bacterium]